MTAVMATGWMLVALPVAFNAAFAGLAATFDYPSILRKPTGEVLARFRAGGSRLVLLWWGFAMTSVLLAPLAVMLSSVLVDGNPVLLTVAATVGVLAAMVQFVGLIRWPFLVPYLARAYADPETAPAAREAVDVVFQATNRFLGVAIGEHLGYLLTGAWSILVGSAIVQGATLPAWLGVAGIVVGAVLLLCSFEFVGPFERDGWPVAAALTPVAYVLWSLWLVADGILLLLAPAP